MKNVVSVVGLGYVGLPLALAIAKSGNKVFGIDTNPELVNDLNSCKIENVDMKKFENELDLLVSNKLFSPVGDFEFVSKCSIIIVCLPTPLTEKGEPNLDILLAGLKSIKKFIKTGATLIVESTVYPGTMEEIVVKLFQDIDINLGYSPERIDPGNKDFDLGNTPKIISAFDIPTLNIMKDFYGQFTEKVHVMESVKAAEFAKIIENTYRLVNISLVNELLQIGNALGVNVRSALAAAATKPFGFQLFTPGIGAGGHCVPVDPVYLEWKVSTIDKSLSKVLTAAIQVNNEMPNYVCQKVKDLIPSGQAKILLYGISYKKGVSDTRESPSLKIRSILKNEGHFIYWFDPNIEEYDDEKRVENIYDFDLVIIMNYDKTLYLDELMKSNIRILDCTGLANKSNSIYYL
jgi:UDP-N-acetyl-D-glucosamine dehydrogenase